MQASDLIERFYDTPEWLAARRFRMGSIETTPLGRYAAGDLRKWTSTMSYITLALTRFVEEAPGDLSTLGVAPDQVWRQLAEALLTWPEHDDSGPWRDALTLLLEGCLEPMFALSPYRALPACLCHEEDGAPGARPLAGQLCFRYFGVEAEGNNAQLAEAAESMALAARALGQPKWAAYGQKQLEWIYGFNPDETCMMTGLGYSRAAVFSFYVGQIPGAIINGYTGTLDTDEPVLWMNREVSPMNMEYWSVHTAAVLRALATLENEPLR